MDVLPSSEGIADAFSVCGPFFDSTLTVISSITWEVINEQNIS